MRPSAPLPALGSWNRPRPETPPSGRRDFLGRPGGRGGAVGGRFPGPWPAVAVAPWGSGPISCSELRNPLKSGKNLTPRGFPVPLLGPSFGLEGGASKRGWGVGWGSMPSLFRWDWRPCPSGNESPRCSQVLEFSGTSEPAVGWVGRDVSPGACRRNLSPVPKSHHPLTSPCLGASSGGHSAF